MNREMERLSPLAHYRKRAGHTLKELADLVGTSVPQLQRLEKGTRRLDDDWKKKLAPHLGVEPWQLTEGAPMEINKASSQIGLIPVTGKVEAGAWRDADEWGADLGISLPIVASQYENCFAVEIAGDSMNLFYKDGEFAIVCPLEFYPRRLQPLEQVIVRRIKKDGGVETTIKELVIKNGKAELWPRSTNPKYQEPINIHWPYEDPQKSGVELVEICGVVISSYKKLREL